MAPLLMRFADSGPAVHVAPAGALHLWGWTITNSILYGWAATLLLTILLVWAAKRATLRPKRGPLQFVEIGVEFIGNLVMNAFDDKKVARKYAPVFITIFFFIILNNWLGLLPFVGEGFQRGDNPLLRPFTGDLNGTFAIGLFTMVFVYAASIKESGGVIKYLRHFFIGSPKNPLFFIIGVLEMLTDLTRVVSLSLRLFLNVSIGEILIAVFAYLGHVAAPLTALPFTLLEIFVGALQAYIFVVLSTMYLAIAVNHTQHDAEHDAERLTEDDQPETIGVSHPAGAKG